MSEEIKPVTLEIFPTRGPEITLFKFKIQNAPIIQIMKPPYAYGPENHLIFYIESPEPLSGQTFVYTTWVKKIDDEIKFNPYLTAKARDEELPRPRVEGWNRWFCALYHPIDFSKNGDVLGTPLASCVMILDPVE